MKVRGVSGNRNREGFRNGKIQSAAIMLLLLLTFLLAACGAGGVKDEGNAVADGAKTESSSTVQSDSYGTNDSSAADLQAEQAMADGSMPEGGAPGQTGQPEQGGQTIPNGEAGDSGRTLATARLSYASYFYVDSGDESMPKMIRNVEMPVETADGSREALLCGIVDALRSIPQGLAGAETMVSDLYRINSITIEQDTAVVDISGSGIANSSPFDEEFFVYQVADSILHSDTSIRKVRFTVDGSADRGLLYMNMHQDYDAGTCDAFCG